MCINIFYICKNHTRNKVFYLTPFYFPRQMPIYEPMTKLFEFRKTNRCRHL